MHGKFQPPLGGQLPSPHARKFDEDRRHPQLGVQLPSPHNIKKPEDDRRYPRTPARPFGQAGRSLLQASHFDARSPSPPPSRGGLRSESRTDEDDALGETNYRDQMRAQLKSSHCLLQADHRQREADNRQAAREQKIACDLPPEFQSLQEQATPRRRTSKGSGPPSQAMPMPAFASEARASSKGAARSSSKGDANALPSHLPAMSPSPIEDPRDVPRGEGAAALARAKSDAKARMSACFEDLISFLEMNGLSGAYALAFASGGVQDLSQLLLLEDEELEVVIKQSDMDAMDEILLRDALGHSRPPK